jgi:glycosyltransferase involved in cell wall biosynthesis
MTEIDVPGAQLSAAGDPGPDVERLALVTGDGESPAPDPLRSASVLIVGVHYAPETLGIGPQTTAMARDLARIARRVTVFTGVPHQPPGLLPRAYGRDRRARELDAGVHLVRHRHHCPRSGGTGSSWLDLPGRIRYEAGFARAVLATEVMQAPDVVIGVTPSIGGAVAAARLADRFGAPLLLVVQDLIGGRNARGGPVLTELVRRQAETLRRAGGVVVVRDELRAGVLALGIEPARIAMIPGGADPAGSPDGGRAATRARLGIPDGALAVVRSGNIGFGQDVPTVVRAARRIAGRGPEIHFRLIGDGSQRRVLESAAADLPAVRFGDPVTAEQYPGLLAAADVLLLTERPGHPDRALSSKLYSYLAAGRPVVAAVNPGLLTDQVLATVADAVVPVLPGDAQALATVLTRLRDHPAERERMAAAALGYAAALPGATGAGAAGTRTSQAGEALRDRVRSLLR